MTFTSFLFKYVDLCFAVQEGPCVKRVRHVTSSSQIRAYRPLLLYGDHQTLTPNFAIKFEKEN